MNANRQKRIAMLLEAAARVYASFPNKVPDTSRKLAVRYAYDMLEEIEAHEERLGSSNGGSSRRK